MDPTQFRIFQLQEVVLPSFLHMRFFMHLGAGMNSLDQTVIILLQYNWIMLKIVSSF